MTRVAIAALLIAALSGCGRAPAPLADKPVLMLISGLPLVNGERFAIDAVGSPTLARLEQQFEVRPIATSDRASLRGGGLLLMAQPRAQPAEALVDLDAWVRNGGRVAILADPRLDWPSARAPGDALRPPFAFADTGLLAHWGVALDAPDVAGPADRRLEGHVVATSSPGTLRPVGRGACVILDDGFVARCTLGKGAALIIADADFLNGDDDDRDAIVATIERFRQTH